MTKIFKTFGFAIIVALLGMITTPAYAEEVTLSGASCFPIGSPPSKPFEAVVQAINEKGKGIVQIDLKGGAPAIGSPFTLTQKMSKGAYDIVGCTEAYFGNVIPEAPVFRLSDGNWAKLRKNGAIAYAQKLLNAKNIHYIARHWTFGKFHLWLNEKNKIAQPDLSGLHLRVAPVYTAFFKSLGATTQTATIAQVYTYMENGTVQGYGWPAASWVPSWTKVTKYRVDPGFYDAALHTLANLKKWQSLTQKQRHFLTKIGLEFEAKSEPGNEGLAKLLKSQNDLRAKAGMEIITFTGVNAEKWLNAAHQAAWNEVVERSPEHGPKLQKLFGN